MVKTGTEAMATPGSTSPTPPAKKARTRTVAKAARKDPPTPEEDHGDPNKRLFGKMTMTPVKRKESVWVGIMPVVVKKALAYGPNNIFGEGQTLHETTRKVLATFHNAFNVSPKERD